MTAPAQDQPAGPSPTVPDLSGHVAVVTGGRGDIGRALVEGLRQAGAQVSVADLTPLPETSVPGVDHVQLDVADPDQVARWLDDVQTRLGPVSVAIPAAATTTPSSALAMTPEQWSAELLVDLSAPFFLAREVAARLVAAGRPGRIVMIGSWAAHAPHPHIPAYSVAKAGLRMLTRCLAAELGPHQILVNELAIGVVDAGVSRQVFEHQPHLRDRSAAMAPTGRMVGVSEIVAEVLALCDPYRQSMTGATVLLDGGMSLRTAFSGSGDD